MRWMTRTAAVFAVTLAALWVAITQIGALTSALTSEPEARSFSARDRAEERRPIVTVAVTEETSFTGQITGFSTATAPRRVSLVAPVQGVVETVMDGLRDGARVEAGDLLIALEAGDADRAVAEAEVALRRAEQERRDIDRRLEEAAISITREEQLLTIRRAELVRINDLLSRGTGTEQQRDTASTALITAEQSLATRQSEAATLENDLLLADLTVVDAARSLEEAQASRADHLVTAPLSGVFEGAAPVPGAFISGNEALGDIVDDTVIELMLDLAPSETARLERVAGQPFSLMRQGDGRAFTAQIDRRSTETEEEGATRNVLIARVDADPCRCLFAGDQLAFTIPEAALNDVVIFPASAVSTTSTVLALGPEDRLIERPITILRRAGALVIAEAPPEPVTYVMTRAPQLGPGLAVRPRTEDGDNARTLMPEEGTDTRHASARRAEPPLSDGG